MNAANEIAVQAFLDGKIRLSEICKIIETVMNQHQTRTISNLELILDVDRLSRIQAQAEIKDKNAANLS
jgi:1-deoxy-D-xylulose-5-phosphate reductoisomerase